MPAQAPSTRCWVVSTQRRSNPLLAKSSSRLHTVPESNPLLYTPVTVTHTPLHRLAHRLRTPLLSVDHLRQVLHLALRRRPTHYTSWWVPVRSWWGHCRSGALQHFQAVYPCTQAVRLGSSSLPSCSLMRQTSVWQVPDWTVSCSGVQLNWPRHLLKRHLMLQDNYRLYMDIESTC